MNSTIEELGMTCASCGSDHLTTRMEVDEFPYGIEGDPVILKARVKVFHCRDCQFDFTGPSAEVARHAAVCRHLGIMKPAEIREVREKYGLSRGAFASVTRIGEASIGRWEAGSHLQSRAFDNFLYLLRYEENLIRLRSRFKEFIAPETPSNVVEFSKFQCIEATDQVCLEQTRFELRPDLISEAA